MDPADPKPDERRLHKRVAVELAVRLRFESVDELLSAHTKDLSQGGMFLKGLVCNSSGEPLLAGQRFLLQFDACGERVVSGEARIVRVSHDGVAIEFVDLEELNAELIHAIMQRDLLDLG